MQCGEVATSAAADHTGSFLRRLQIRASLYHILGTNGTLGRIKLRKLVFRQLDVASKDCMLLHHAASLPLHARRIDLVPIAHMRVLLAPLLKSLRAAHDGAGERLLTRVRPDVILQCTHRLAATTTVVALMLTFACTTLLMQAGTWLP